MQLDGSSDLSKTVEIMFKNFKTFIQREIVNVVAWRVAKSVEETLNQILIQNTQGEVSDAKMSNVWNIKLLQAPVFKTNYVSFILDGQVKTINN